MTDNSTDNDTLINLYLKNQEEFSIELMRRMLESTAKHQLKELTIVELKKSLETIRVTEVQAQELLQQSITGLTEVTRERDRLLAEVDRLRRENEVTSSRVNDILDASNKLNVLQSDYNTLKSNYNKVSAALIAATDKITVLSESIVVTPPTSVAESKTTKKVKSKIAPVVDTSNNPEWVENAD
jgi:uncharacterized phage infection (PIP) family protein YhgE